MIGWILVQARQVPIRRGTGDTGALAEAVAAAESGSCVGIFPRDGWATIPRTGSSASARDPRIAIPSGAPVVPVGIGAHDVWPRSGLDRMSLLRRHTLGVVYGDALVPHPGESPTTFRERFRVALEVAVARAGRSPEARRDPAR